MSRTDKPDQSETPDREPPGQTPPQGPHGKPDLTNPDATPGAGSLPSPEGEDDRDADVGSD